MSDDECGRRVQGQRVATTARVVSDYEGVKQWS